MSRRRATPAVAARRGMTQRLAARRRRATTAVVAAALAALALAVPAPATNLPQRTLRISATVDGAPADGASRDPALSADGRTIAFATAATNLAPGDANGAAPDIVTVDLVSGERRIASAGAPGPASAPALSADGSKVVFASGGEVFLRDGDAPLLRVSDPRDGEASEPAISADGSTVAYTAAGRILVADVRTGRITSATVTPAGAPADGPSAAPALNRDGAIVAFASKATNLVRGDTNAIGDVFVRDLGRGRTERVSVSSSGRQQDRAVADAFSQVPDISADGRYVVFDSDATTLVRGDANRRTDVFLRDRRRHRTTLVSVSATDVQGDNDSFAPRLTPDGRFVAFESFAGNLTPGEDGPREDVFLRDVRRGGTTVVTVADGGRSRGPEAVRQLLQRPSLAADGRVVAFSSTAPGLAPGDDDALQDVFVRLTEPPRGRVSVRRPGGRAVVRVAADDPRATRHLCRVDGGRPFLCGDVVRPRRGAHVLTVRAGGPGMLFDPAPRRVVLGRSGPPPVVRIARPAGHRLRVVRGTARGAAGVSRVEVAVTYLRSRGSCAALRGRRFAAAPCTRLAFVRADGTRRWRLRLPRAIRGPVIVAARAVDGAGRRGRTVSLKILIG
jgi:Tol biopolymer transport system component